jgi:hypothetical protein
MNAPNTPMMSPKTVLQLKRIQAINLMQATSKLKVSATRNRLDGELNVNNELNVQK